MELDPTDRILVDAILRDANQRLEDLARLVDLAPSSVHDRVRRLERDGVIRRWTVDIDVAAIGLHVLAYVGLRSTRPCSTLLPALEAMPEIEEAHSVAGATSMLLKLRVASTSALLEMVDRLRQIPGVEGTETSIVLRTQLDRPVSVPSARPPVKAGRRAR